MNKGSVDDGVVFHAGFPNAAEDEKFGSLSLDALVVKHRASTFFWRLETEVPELFWPSGSVLVVDRALDPKEGSVVVATSGDEFILTRLRAGKMYRLSGERMEADVSVWGVVTYVIQPV